MDRKLLERMVGASLLVLAVVIIAPTILDGGEQRGSTGAVATVPAAASGMKTHTIRLDREPDRPPIARAVQPPVQDTTPAVAKEAPGPVPAEESTVTPPAPAEVARPVVVVNNATERAAPESQEPARAFAPRPPEPDRSPPAGDVASASVSESGWAVQLGAFSQSGSAKRLEAQVQGRGFPAYVVTVELADKTLYRVRVGPEETRDQASRLAGKLAAAGFDGGQVIAQKPGA